MKKKTMLFASAALAALFVAALPIAAYAGEFTADCGTGPTCTGTVEGTGNFVFSDSQGLIWFCPSFIGTMSFTSGSSTGSLQLQLQGCVDPYFQFKCNGNGVATSNSMVTHNVYLEANHSTPGLLITGASLTISCVSPLGARTFTGDVVSHIENPDCNASKTNHTFALERTSVGQQKYRQVTTTGSIFDLMEINELNGSSLTASWSATWHVNYTGGNTVKFTC